MKKRFLACLLCLIVMISFISSTSVMAAEEMYPYMIFAASSAKGAVTIETQYLCANGDIATNGTVVSSVDMENLGGEVFENSGVSMVSLDEKLFAGYFSSEAEKFVGDYISDEMN